MKQSHSTTDMIKPLAGAFARHVQTFGEYRGWGGEPPAFHDGRWTWRSCSPEGLVADWAITQFSNHRAGTLSVEVNNPTEEEIKLHYANFMEIVLAPQDGPPYRIFRVGGGSQDGSYPPNSYRTEQLSVYDSIFSGSDPVSGRTTGQYLPITMVAASDIHLRDVTPGCVQEKISWIVDSRWS